MGPGGVSFLQTLQSKRFPPVPFFLISHHITKDQKKIALDAGMNDVFLHPLQQDALEARVNFMITHWQELQAKQQRVKTHSYRVPLIKRLFDLFFAGLALVFLSPLFLIIYLTIRLGSKGPAFYYSLRVGTGYRIFRFYKFRSMYVDADKRLKDLKHLNQYTTEDTATGQVQQTESQYLCDECKLAGSQCQYPVYADDMRMCEKDYLDTQKNKAGAAFFKLKDDPRITKIGKFIRNTSIDELPQLWNVIIGDMSIEARRVF
jgi:lipopolysaccharide/colanic/teichoic acid biosynthesis glycosyltransferase